MTETVPPALLTPDQIQAALTQTDPKYVRPFSDAGERLMDWLINDEGRYMLGIKPLDAMLRGIGRGELAYVIGRAHSGKTQLCLNAVNNNAHKNQLFFTPDEVDVLLLTKLIAINRGIDAEELENRIKQQDPVAVDMVREVAGKTFRNFFAVDRGLTFDQMSRALEEARQMWGGQADAVFIDFLELLPGTGDFEGVTALSQQLKNWAKNEDVSCICLHQSSRSSGDRGKASGMDAMRYGGETEAIYVLEVFRKKEGFDMTKPDEYAQWEEHEETVTVSVAKNKRPPGKKGEIDLHMDGSTGRIMSFDEVPATNPLRRVDTSQQGWYDDDEEEPF